MADDTNNRDTDPEARKQAVAQLDDSGDSCGPEPERPTYFSPQAVRDKWYEWKLCKDGA